MNLTDARAIDRLEKHTWDDFFETAELRAYLHALMREYIEGKESAHIAILFRGDKVRKEVDITLLMQRVAEHIERREKDGRSS